MASVDFSANDVTDFRYKLDDFISDLNSELDSARYAKEACCDIVSEIENEADKCIDSIISDLNQAEIVKSRNYRKLDDLKSKLSSLGTGEENASQRNSVKSQISAVENKIKAVDTIINTLWKMRSAIENTVDEYKRYLDKVKSNYDKLNKRCNEAQKSIERLKYDALKAEELAVEIVKELMFYQKTITFPEGERITVSDVGAINRFALALSNKKTLLLRNKKEITEAAYDLRESITDEISSVAVEVVSEMVTDAEEFGDFLGKTSAAFFRAGEMLYEYVDIGK